MKDTKKLFLIAIVSFFLFSCAEQSKQEIAENVAKEYLKKNLDDPSSYEPVSFTKLDSIMENGKVQCYVFKHEYRAKNKMGALVLTANKVVLEPDLKLRFFDTY